MTKTGENATQEFFTGYYQGKQVRFVKNKQTEEITIHADDVAQVMGYQDLDEMMADDAILDEMNRIHKETGVFPISAGIEDTEAEKFEYFASCYPEEIEHAIGSNSDCAVDPINLAIDIIIADNTTIEDIEVVPCYSEKLIDDTVQRENFFGLTITPRDSQQLILTRTDLQAMLNFLDTYGPSNGKAPDNQ